ncbi:MAG: F0F1 ATP synthase subunit B [Gammaproteobacteria bacterium]|nr:F0F1 ATP synthase subunit B [Gammaproteobacteria bacterium]
MNINATLIGQAITFFIFIWFCMKYVWPPIMQALNERKQNIADGLAAAERGRHEHELAERRAIDILHEAKEEARSIITQAHNRGTELVEESKGNAGVEGERIITAARAEIEQEVNRAKEELRKQVALLAVEGASRVIKREIDAKTHDELLASVAAQI